MFLRATFASGLLIGSNVPGEAINAASVADSSTSSWAAE
jgi:hypothetical protein